MRCILDRVAGMVVALVLCSMAPQAAAWATSASTVQDGATLLVSYKSALATWDQVRVDAVRANAQLSALHPARVFWPRFVSAAESGTDAAALGWLATQAHFALDAGPARGQAVQGALQTLLAKHPASQELHDALAGLLTCRADLSEEQSLAFLSLVAEQAQADETRARALFTASLLVSDNLRTDDPKRRAQADELHRAILYAWPKTKAGAEAAGRLYPVLERRFAVAASQWQDTVEVLQRNGTRYAEWPEHPLVKHVDDARLLALAGHNTALRMVEVTWPAIDQARRQSASLGLCYLFTGMMQHYPPRAEVWDRLRPRILTLALREYPNERWAREAFEVLRAEVDRLPPMAADSACRAALETHEDARVRAWAWWCLARTNLCLGDDAAFGRAQEALTTILDEHADEDARWLEAVRLDRDRIAALRVGQLVPAFTGLDTEKQPVIVQGYKGRVVLLVYWSMLQAESLAAVPDWVALQDALKGRAFDVVGVCWDQISRQADFDTRVQLGVRWRSIMTYTRDHELYATGMVLRAPTVVVLDDQGVIRGRNLPWAETRALVERLVAEHEANLRR